MKKIKYILLTASVIFMAGCNEDIEFADLNIELLPGKYVAFSADGANNSIPDIDVTEEGGTTELNVEVPTGSTSNVTINFTFSGNAVYGVDYTVSGATAAGGSVVIVPDPGNDPADLIDNVDIDITFLTDGIADGDKTLTVTLTSASNSEGEVLTGRGGTDLLKSQNINICDVDFGFAAGDYDVTGTILADDLNSGPYSFEETVHTEVCGVDGAYLVQDITGGLYTNDYGTAYDVDPAEATLNFEATGGDVTWSDVSSQRDGEIVEDTAAPETSNYNATTGVITIYWMIAETGERGITVFTKQP